LHFAFSVLHFCISPNQLDAVAVGSGLNEWRDSQAFAGSKCNSTRII
jgi:hypothetical protein